MEIFGGLGVVVAFLFAAIALLAPIWLYLINDYTGASLDELKKVNKNLERLADLIEQQTSLTFKAQESDNTTIGQNLAEMTCPECGKYLKYHTKHSGKYKPCPKCNKSILLK